MTECLKGVSILAGAAAERPVPKANPPAAKEAVLRKCRREGFIVCGKAIPVGLDQAQWISVAFFRRGVEMKAFSSVSRARTSVPSLP